MAGKQNSPHPLWLLYQSRRFVAACLSCWDWTKKRKSYAWGNHHLLLVICEWSITAGLSIVVNISFVKALFSNLQILYFWEPAWDRKRLFLEHIFKVMSFYFIYRVFLFSVDCLFIFSSLFMMMVIIWNSNRTYCPVKICCATSGV